MQAAVEAETKEKYACFEPVFVKTQVVAGVNFFVKVSQGLVSCVAPRTKLQIQHYMLFLLQSCFTGVYFQYCCMYSHQKPCF